VVPLYLAWWARFCHAASVIFPADFELLLKPVFFRTLRATLTNESARRAARISAFGFVGFMVGRFQGVPSFFALRGVPSLFVGQAVPAAAPGGACGP